MRTKTLLLAAAALVAGISASQAQVYSVNAVGYINVVVKPGFNIIANQLITTNSTVANLFANVPANSKLLNWAGTGFIDNLLDPDFGWDNPDQVVAPGQAVFFQNQGTTNVTITFVGDVPQGNLTNTFPTSYSLRSSIVPQAGLLQAALGYTPSPGDHILRWINNHPAPGSGYFDYEYDAEFGW
ncbi:MAG TPA: hypothetical protein VK530_18460, partial [Candidatus Acidoferrum sp.]|nr:hypothetical protein [Candidatus Acidoferrum sp.]